MFIPGWFCTLNSKEVIVSCDGLCFNDLSYTFCKYWNSYTVLVATHKVKSILPSFSLAPEVSLLIAPEAPPSRWLAGHSALCVTESSPYSAAASSLGASPSD